MKKNNPSRLLFARTGVRLLAAANLGFYAGICLLSMAGTPFMEERFTLPGTIEFEHFDRNGGDYDLDAVSNQTFRNSGADLIPCNDQGGGFALSYCQGGEYVDYSVRVPTPGQYSIQVRAIASNYGSSLRFDFIKVSDGSLEASTTANTT